LLNLIAYRLAISYKIDIYSIKHICNFCKINCKVMMLGSQDESKSNAFFTNDNIACVFYDLHIIRLNTYFS